MQEEYDCYYMIADLHTLTIRINPETLRENIKSLIAIYVACGLDPEKNNLFIQSHIQAHSELAWILNCYTYIGELSRMTQFKDKSLKNQDNINAGLFTYPVLMAADILLYQTNLVPVGEDQKQHLEITRDIAERFNHIYGDTFTVPNPYIAKAGAKIMGLQDPLAKMSKSSTNVNDTIFLLDTKEDILKKFKKAVTDSEGIVRFDIENKPGVSNLMTIYGVVTEKSKDEVEKEFSGIGYGSFKETVANAVIDKLIPIQEKYHKLMKDPKYVEAIYQKGAKNAEEIANKTLMDVKLKVGLILK